MFLGVYQLVVVFSLQNKFSNLLLLSTFHFLESWLVSYVATGEFIICNNAVSIFVFFSPSLFNI